MEKRLNEVLTDTLHEWEVDCQPETIDQMTEHLMENGVTVPVRCRHCKFHHWEQEPCHGKTEHFCSVLNAQVFADFYCYHGKPKEHSKNNAEEKCLTIKELQQMEGNIVFLIPLNDWAKVMHYGLVYFGTEKNSLWQDIVGDYGKKWLAYAQKPREREREELTNLLLRKDDRQ